MGAPVLQRSTAAHAAVAFAIGGLLLAAMAVSVLPGLAELTGCSDAPGGTQPPSATADETIPAAYLTLFQQEQPMPSRGRCRPRSRVLECNSLPGRRGEARRRQRRAEETMPSSSRPPLDRVAERPRVAALARHYRDAEHLSIAEIARRLGRAQTTVKAYLYDPPARRRVRSRPATAATAAPAAPTRARATARATPTCTAGAAAQAPPNATGRASAYARRCANGPSSTAAHRRHMTGRGRMRAVAARRRWGGSSEARGLRPRP